MKKIPGATKPPGIFLQAATLWNFEKSPSRQELIGHLIKGWPTEAYLEAWAVNATAFRTTDLVDKREFERAITIGGREQARSVDVVAEADVELLIIEAGAYDQGIHQFLVVQFVRNTRPETELESLVVATAVAEQELEGVTHIHLPGWTLEESNHPWVKTELLAGHELTTCVEGELAVKRNVCILERLVGAVQVVECTSEVEAGFFAEYAEPQHPCRKVGEEETRVSDGFADQVAVKSAIAIVLAWPLKVVAFDATVAQADVGAKHEIVCFFAVASHFLCVRARETCLNGGKFRGAGFVAPKGAAHSEIVVATYRKFLIVGCRIRVVGAVFENRRPLIAIIGYQAVVAIHHTSHGWIKIKRALVELRKVDVLGLCHCREHHEAQRKNV